LPDAFVAFDCETSGLDPRTDGILQLAAVAMEGGAPAGSFVSLVRPDGPVPLAVLRLTGLDAEALSAAPPLEDQLPRFLDFVAGRPLVAHNAAFDRAFLDAALRRCGLPPLRLPVHDTHGLSQLVAPLMARRRLGDLAERWSIPLHQAHDALHDASATALLFARLQDELRARPAELLLTLEALLRPVGGELWDLVRETLGLVPPPSVLRPLVASAPAAPARPRPEVERPPEPLALEALFEPRGPVAQALGEDAYESRPGQLRMLEAVARAFRQDRHLVVEAGTGTGKSLAYLAPAVSWAAAIGQRVVVATHTLNLQEQLLDKDIPLVRRCTGAEVDAVALKGRGNYLCLRLWEEALAMEPTAADGFFLARVAAWLASTPTGDRAELGVFGDDEERWSRLAADGVACTGSRCPWYEPCFLFRARRRAEAAEVVVVNHALLLSDLGAEGQVLPPHDYLICDEAHHLEDQAAQHLGVTLGERRTERFFASLEAGVGARTRGVLPALRRSLEAVAALSGGAIEDLQAAGARLAGARQAAADCFALLRHWLVRRGAGGGGFRLTVRFEPRPTDDEAWDGALSAGRRCAEELAALAASLAHAARNLDEAPFLAASDGSRVAELTALAAQARELGAALLRCLEGEEGWVTWVEAVRREGLPGALQLHAAPLEPGPLLAEGLFGRRRSVVLTSATLSVGGDFRFIRERLGVADGPEAERVDTLQVPSPFDFRHQALLCVPDDLPDARRVGPEAHAAALVPFLVRLLRTTGGRALVLFTAHRLLRLVHRDLKAALEPEGISVLGQGLDGSRGRLAAALASGDPTVVLGAASFWEGVDVPGEALSCVVIAQLPFWAPDIPLVQARAEALERSGRSSFSALSLPQAVLRFKQGFGRLIRSGRDRGVAVVLDGRLVRSTYGRVFRDSLPGPAFCVAPGDQVIERVAAWLRPRSGEAPGDAEPA
jgi:ATP-dependent DNA helicase DinG